ncbi:hypothetical protein [Camelimonas lactis]|uniref:Uncharacterized protein n=1 Tax=Camelimonas lactis TaxID=659006 RepID=A0A4R2GQW8_9HYPH|nr:hypothetical protein [Camelimonas lactis]TCO11228.1 hypothetical protein EV666_11364 [Camelimonas lactis]
MNVAATTRKAAIAFVAAAIGGFGLAAATPASAGPKHGHGYGYGYGHHHRHGHFYRPGYVYGGAGLVGGLALGAIAASAMTAPPVCYVSREPVIDPWGNVIRYRAVRVCD